MGAARAYSHPLLSQPRRAKKCIWEITRACDLRCIHCENRSGPRSPGELDDQQLLATAAALVALGCREVVLTGGEPLRRPVWSGLCRSLRDLGARVSLVTNGILLDEEHLAEALAAGVEVVGISLHGLAATHDRIRVRARSGPSPWRLAVDALARSARRVSTVAITQVNRMNLGELPAMGELLAELGVPRWQLQLAIPAGRALEIDEPFVLEPEHLEELVAFIVPRLRARSLPLIDVSDTIGYCTGEDALFRGHRRPDGSIAPGAWLGCTAGLTSLAITYDGRVRGCSLLPEELDAGSLHDEPLATIWNDAHRFAYTTEFHPSWLSGSCAGCRLGGLCRGGCTTLAYFSTGSVAENPYCLRAQRGHP